MLWAFDGNFMGFYGILWEIYRNFMGILWESYGILWEFDGIS